MRNGHLRYALHSHVRFLWIVSRGWHVGCTPRRTYVR